MTEAASTNRERATAEAVFDLVRRGRAAEAAARLREWPAPPAPAAWYRLAVAAVARPDGDAAEPLRQAAAAVAALPPGADHADALRALAGELLLAGRLDEAERSLAAASEEYSALGLAAAVASCRYNQGLVLKSRGHLTAALGMVEAARGPLARHAGPEDLARLDLNRASILTDLGRFEAARQAAQAAVAGFLAGDQPVDLARARWAAAAAAAGLRLHQDALEGFRQAAEALERCGRPDEAAAVRINMGDVYRACGDPALALEELACAEALLGDRQPVFSACLQLNRGAVLLDQGQPAEALAAFQSAGRLFTVQGCAIEAGETALWQARAALVLGDRPMADRLLDTARQTVSRQGLPHELAAVDLVRADVALGDGDLVLAEETYWSVLGLAAEPLADLRWRAWRGLMQVSAARGEAVAALDQGRQAVAALEQLAAGLRMDLLRLGFHDAEDHNRLYAEVLRLCAELGEAAVAFDLMQRAKAQSLAEAVSAAEPLAAVPDPQWLARDRELFGRVSELLREAEAVRERPEDYRDWVTQLGAARRELYELRLQATHEGWPSGPIGSEPPSLAAVQSRLAPGDVLLETFVCGDDVYLLAAGTEDVEYVGLPGRARLVDEVLNQLEAGVALLVGAPAHLIGRVAPSLQAAAEADCEALYDLLLEPVAAVTDGAERLLVAPHGRLWAVPWAALHDGLAALLERVPIGLVPSAATWWRLAERGRRDGCGGAVIAGDDSGLTAAAEELATIGRLLAAPVLRGEQAGREAVLAAVATARWVHFSGHAEFRPESPLFSALCLPGGERVTAADLYRRRLRADLVTLAACETGRSYGPGGADLMGLVGGFLHAGADCVVATLWSAPDSATARLMAEFYRHYATEPAAAGALAAAQLAVRQVQPHPLFWAGFAVVGQPWAS